MVFGGVPVGTVDGDGRTGSQALVGQDVLVAEGSRYTRPPQEHAADRAVCGGERREEKRVHDGHSQ